MAKKQESAAERFAIRSESALYRAGFVNILLKRLVKDYASGRIDYGHVGTMAHFDDQLGELITALGYALHPEAQDLPEAEMLAAMESGALK
jgi:hypothetical protein